ncbi:MAG TPA: phosphotransferase, partial [Candidatus Limnocylindrales bacterium]|nr:phosphotransferase [Candidatus Limnocylindrales bacterium]
MPIDDIAARLWPGRRPAIEPIAAGLTNANFRVEVDGTPYFVRVPGASTDLLAVDRGNELHNTRAAAASGVGAAVVAQDPDTGAFALEWIDGRTMSNAAFAADAFAPQRIAASLRQLHAGPR